MMIMRDSINVLPELAPTPPGVEACSCDESLALRRELGEARARLARPLDARQSALANAWGAGGAGSD